MTAKDVFILGVPGLMVVVSGVSLVASVRALRSATWVRGRVTGHQESPDPDGPGRLYRSVIAVSNGAVEREVLDDMAFGWRAHRVGNDVWVRVAPEQPDSVAVWRVWPILMMAGLMLVGGVFLALGLSRAGNG